MSGVRERESEMGRGGGEGEKCHRITTQKFASLFTDTFAITAVRMASVTIRFWPLTDSVFIPNGHSTAKNHVRGQERERERGGGGGGGGRKNVIESPLKNLLHFSWTRSQLLPLEWLPPQRALATD